MANRQQRRAAAAKEPKHKNVSGTPDKCGNCRFARPAGTPDGDITCHRFPPQINPMNGFCAFPSLKDWGWCGEYVPPASKVN